MKNLYIRTLFATLAFMFMVTVIGCSGVALVYAAKYFNVDPLFGIFGFLFFILYVGIFHELKERT